MGFLFEDDDQITNDLEGGFIKGFYLKDSELSKDLASGEYDDDDEYEDESPFKNYRYAFSWQIGQIIRSILSPVLILLCANNYLNNELEVYPSRSQNSTKPKSRFALVMSNLGKSSASAVYYFRHHRYFFSLRQYEHNHRLLIFTRYGAEYLNTDSDNPFVPLLLPLFAVLYITFMVMDAAVYLAIYFPILTMLDVIVASVALVGFALGLAEAVITGFANVVVACFAGFANILGIASKDTANPKPSKTQTTQLSEEQAFTNLKEALANRLQNKNSSRLEIMQNDTLSSQLLSSDPFKEAAKVYLNSLINNHQVNVDSQYKGLLVENMIVHLCKKMAENVTIQQEDLNYFCHTKIGEILPDRSTAGESTPGESTPDEPMSVVDPGSSTNNSSVGSISTNASDRGPSGQGAGQHVREVTFDLSGLPGSSKEDKPR